MRTALDLLLIALVWAGASAAVLTTRRVLSCGGVALAAAAAAGLLAILGFPAAGALLGLGGLTGAAFAAAGPMRGHGYLPPGSAPVITLCVVVGALSAWIGGSVLNGPGGSSGRTAALCLLGLGAARLVAGRDPDRLAAPALLAALGVGLAGGFQTAGIAVAGAAGGCAALLGVLARARPSAA